MIAKTTSQIYYQMVGHFPCELISEVVFTFAKIYERWIQEHANLGVMWVRGFKPDRFYTNLMP